MIAPANSGMNNRRLQEILRRECARIEGELGFWQVSFKDRDLLVVTDESHNRMRIMTPIAAEDRITEEELRILLAANFDRALDAKFAMSHGQLWSVFVHPLGQLADEMVLDALQQVATLADNYGTTYASTELFFAGGD
jgi:hypothetical protein